ncbi:hypothetical protein AB0P15_31255 [Streptomyces sp. NPDC087917]|uniref:hypothetical protein n=1 Tax=Streptomyces sp. NPDC087917 TaxID=3155060 RepID=UPI00344AAC64
MPDSNSITQVIGLELELPGDATGRSAQLHASSVDAGSDGQATSEAADAGIIPSTVTVTMTENRAAVDARDALLRAIGREADQVVGSSAGQASAALEQLARAYVLVTTGAAPTPVSGVTQVAGMSRSVGYGAGRPVADNAVEAGRAVNRRVEDE